MTRPRLIALGLTAAAALGLPAPAQAQGTCDRSFNGSAGSDWSNALNWTPSGVPGATERVCLPDVAGLDAVTVGQGHQVAAVTAAEELRVTSGGSLRVGRGDLSRATVAGGTLEVAEALRAGVLTVTSGLVTGSGAVDVDGAFRWSGGELAGLGTTTAWGAFAMTGGTYLHDRTLLVAGDGAWTGRASRPTLTGVAALLVSGTLDLAATDGSYFESYRYGYWSNAPVVRVLGGGTITRSAGGEAGSFIPFDVDGRMAPAAGEIRLHAGLRGAAGSDPGSTGALGGAGTVAIAGGSGVIAAGAAIDGAVRVTGGTTTLAGAVTGAAQGRLEVAGGTLTGPGDVDLQGELALTGGEFTGTGTATVERLAISGAPLIFDRTVHLLGTGAWTGEASRPVIKGTGRLVVSGELDARATLGSYIDDYRYGYWGADDTVVRVAPGGRITRSVEGEIGSYVPLDVDGRLAPAAGEIRLHDGLKPAAGGDPGSTGALGGTGMVDVAGGSGVLAGGSTIAGAVEVTGGTTTLTGTTGGTPAGTLEIAGGAVTGPGDVTLPGELRLTGGEFTGTGSAVAERLSMRGSPLVHDRTVRVTGGGAWTGAASRPVIKGTGRLVVEGTFDFAATDGSYFDTYRYGWWGPDDAVVRVAPGGTVTRSVPGEVGAYVPLDVDGRLAPDAGEIRLHGGLKPAVANGDGGSAGALGGDGLVTIAGGAGVIAAGATLPGAVKVAGGTTTLAGTVAGPAAAVLEIAGGTLTGPGDMDLAGELRFTGGELSGTGAATVDRLALSGSPLLFNRTLTVTGSGTWSGATSRPAIKGTASLVIAGTFDAAATDGSYVDNYRYGYWDADASSVRIAPGAEVTRSAAGEIGFYVPVDVDGTLSPGDGASAVLHAGAWGEAVGRFAGAGTTVLAGGTFAARGAAVAGRLAVRQTLRLEGDIRVAPSGVVRQEGTIAGPGRLLVAGRLELAGGTHGGSGLTRIEPGGRLDFTGSTTIDHRSVRNRGTATWTGSDPVSVTLTGDARLENAGTLTLDNTHPSSTWWSTGTAGGQPLLLNHGRMDVSRPPGVGLYLSVPVENDGELRLRGGRAELPQGLRQTPEGVLSVELRGPDPETGFGVAGLGYGSRLHGTLRLSSAQGYAPPAGTTWRIVESWSSPGAFAAVDGARAIPGVLLGAETDGSGVLVTAADAPAPSLTPAPAAAAPAAAPAGKAPEAVPQEAVAKPRTLRVRSGRRLEVSAARGLLRGHEPGSRVRVIGRSRAARGITVQADGAVRFSAPRRAGRMWVDFVVVDPAGVRSAAQRLRIVVR